MSSTEEARVEAEVTLSYRTTRNGKLSVITLNRPDKYNALSGAHYRHLASLMHQIHNDLSTVATVWIGTGSFFSAGADVKSTGSSMPKSADDADIRRFFMETFTAGNLDLTQTFLSHRHPLFICLNGPVIGMTAALVGFGDFIYATEESYLLTPFASLGLAPEGASSVTFPLRMGPTLANRALLTSERITASELLRAGFYTKLFPRAGFEDAVVTYIERLMDDLNVESMRIAKERVVDGIRDRVESANVKEVYHAIDRFSLGIPQAQFMALATRQKKHKL